MSGWIKLHRSLLEWEWYSDHNCLILLIHLLVKVNYEDKKWRGMVIKSGSMVLSWSTLSQECGLSVMQCRTAMDKLIDSGEVTREVTNKYQVISLVKWDKLQGLDSDLTSNLTGKQQTNNKQITTTKESKEYKEMEEDTPPPETHQFDPHTIDQFIDYPELLKYFNSRTGRNEMRVTSTVKGNVKARLWEMVSEQGLSIDKAKEMITAAIKNAASDQWTKEKNLTLVWITSEDAFYKWATTPPKQTRKAPASV